MWSGHSAGWLWEAQAYSHATFPWISFPSDREISRLRACNEWCTMLDAARAPSDCKWSALEPLYAENNNHCLRISLHGGLHIFFFFSLQYRSHHSLSVSADWVELLNPWTHNNTGKPKKWQDSWIAIALIAGLLVITVAWLSYNLPTLILFASPNWDQSAPLTWGFWEKKSFCLFWLVLERSFHGIQNIIQSLFFVRSG